MRWRASGWLLLLLVGLVARRAAAQTCASPIAIPSGGGVFTGTTSGLSQIVLSCTSATANAPEAVYTWTPAVSGTAVVATCGSGFDTVLALETQCGVANSTLSAGCSDDACVCCADCNNQAAAWDSRVTTTVTAGVPLFVIVDGYGMNGHGTYRLVVTPPGVTTTTLLCAATTTSTSTTTTTTTTSTTTTSTTTTTTTTTTAGPTTTTTSTTTSTTTTSTTAPPGTCANPLILPAAGGTVSGTTSGPSLQTGSCGNTSTAPEKVYQWTPSSSGQTTIQTCGAGTAYDTVVYVRSATCTGSEITAGCNDDACANASGLNRASKLTPMVTSGATYFIIVDGYGGASGAYTLSVSTPGAVTTTTTTAAPTTTTTTSTTTTTTTTTTTSTTTTTTTTTTSTTTTTLSAAACASPTVIPAAGGTFTGTTSGSNTLTTPCDAATGPEKVYQWTPSISGVASLQTCGGTTNFDTVLSLRTSPCASGATLANGCNDNLCVCGSTCGNVASKITPTVVAGQTYYAIVDGHAGASGTYTLTVAAPPPPTTTTTSTTAPAASTTTTSLPPLTLTGFVPGVATANDVIVDTATHRAYVASQQFGLSIVDVTTPASPVMVGAANPPFYGFRVAKSGSVAVVTNAGAGLRTVDLTDPTHPVTRGTLAGTFTGVRMTSSTMAYALSSGVGGLSPLAVQPIDVSTLTNPHTVGTALTVNAGTNFALVGTTAYVASGGFGLKIVSVASPLAPVLLGQTGALAGAALDVAVTGTTAYVFMGSAGIQVVNVSDSAHPVLGTVLASSAGAGTIAGTRLYTGDGALLRIIDITTPAAPVELGSGPSYGATRIAVDGATSFMNPVSGGGGLSVQTVSGSTPSLVTNYVDQVGNSGVAVSGTRVVTAGNGGGLKSVSVATPGVPTVSGTYAGFVSAVALSGTTAYAFDGISGLFKVIDISGTPSLVGSVSIGAAGEMQMVGSTVYAASGGFGLRLVNVASPSSPAVSGTANTPGTAQGVAVLGSYAYVADTTTIQVVDVSDPNNPVIVNSVPTQATAVSALGSRLYAVDGNNLKILSLATPAAPSILNASAGAYAAQGVLADPTRPNVVYVASPSLNHGDNPPGIYESLTAVNVANPAAPVQIGTSLVLPGQVKRLAFANGLIYASDSAGIVDVVTP